MAGERTGPPPSSSSQGRGGRGGSNRRAGGGRGGGGGPSAVPGGGGSSGVGGGNRIGGGSGSGRGDSGRGGGRGGRGSSSSSVMSGGSGGRGGGSNQGKRRGGKGGRSGAPIESINPSSVGGRPESAPEAPTSSTSGPSVGVGGGNAGRPSSSGATATPSTSNKGPGKKGGRGSNKRSQRSGRGGRGGDDQRKKEEEQKRLEMERKKKEEEEAAAAAAAAEAERKRLAEIERRQNLQTQYETSVKSGIAMLQSFIDTCKMHSELRSQLDPNPCNSGSDLSALDQSRLSFEKTKKSLKSDLKKCTAFVKKIKSGSFPTVEELSGPRSSSSALATLNLSRYVEEVAAALVEGLSNKLKGADMPGIVMLCVEMHRRYSGFLGALSPTLWAGVSGAGSGGLSTGGEGGDGEQAILPRRVCLRLLTEFVLHGVITDTKAITKVIAEATGAPSSSGHGEDGPTASNKEYAVTDANLVVTFSKTGGHEILGVVPRSIRLEHERLQNEVTGKGEGVLLVDTPAAMEVDNAKNTSEEDKSPNEATSEAFDLESPFQPTLTHEIQKLAKSTMDLFESTAVNSRAVSSHTTTTLHTNISGAYRTLCQSYLSTNLRLIKLEKRCEQDRLLQGNLSESREKGLKDARTLMESLAKSVEALSEALDLNPPVLPNSEEEDRNAENSESTGIELWTKSEHDPTDEERDARLGPFDDEETRSFYCDVPDLLATNPPAMLGIGMDEVDKKKEKNRIQYGIAGGADEAGGDDVDVMAMEVDEEDNDVAKEGAVEEVGGTDEDAVMEESGDGDKDDKENKDTPHYKLMVLLEEELPEASRRETIDELAERFCVNHGSAAKNRKRLYKNLFLVPRARLDLLPYYSRFAAILDRVYSDSTLVTELEQQMHGQARFKKNQNLESRLRTARYLGELTKFRVAPPMVILRGMKRCLEDFSGYNIDVACCILESCGRYLYRTKHTHKKLSELIETMMRIKKAKNLDERHVAMINSAFFMVNPPPQTSKPTKQTPPLEAYLRYLLASRLEADDASVSFVSKQIQRFPWSDPGTDCGALICKYMLKACRKGRYKATKAIAMLAAILKRTKPEVPARLIDAVYEEIQWFLERPNFRDHQRTLVCARVFGELYNSSVISSSLVLDEIHHILNFGHEIPDALRQASENQHTFTQCGTVSQTIHEDEEMEDEDEDVQKEDDQPKVVSVSLFSKYDPRVPCEVDPPNAVFRIKLVCTILETVSSHIVSTNNKAKLEFALASLQRYLFTKISLPSDVEFSVLDVFDALDSQLKKLFPADSKRGSNVKHSSQKGTQQPPALSFVRYGSWIEAHNFVVVAEEAEVLAQARARTRLLAQAGLLQAADASVRDIEGELLEDEIDECHEMTDEDESLESVKDESMEGDSDDESEDDSLASAAEADDSQDETDGSDSGSDAGSDEEEEESDEEDEIDEAAAEAAYARQLQDEAFESELRKLTMEALEKGKVSAKTGTGGKVSAYMPTAPQFIAKKTNTEDSHAEVGVSAEPQFGGDEGMSFKLLKRGHKGRVEEKELLVPTSTNLARRATKQDDEAARERDILKARVLQYEAESAESQHTGGNVYLDQTKLQVIRNRPLSMEVIDRNFGKSTEAPYKLSERYRRQGRGGGRLFNPGRGRS